MIAVERPHRMLHRCRIWCIDSDGLIPVHRSVAGLTSATSTPMTALPKRRPAMRWYRRKPR